MSKIIKTGLIVVFAISLLTGCGNKNKEPITEEKEKIKVNTNEGVINDQTVEVFKMENTSLVYENGTTTLETIVTNTSNETVYLKEFKIKILDYENNIITTLTGFVGSEIKAGESKMITSYCGEDLSSAYKIEYSVIK